jgi:hypothetical protein
MVYGIAVGASVAFWFINLTFKVPLPPVRDYRLRELLKASKKDPEKDTTCIRLYVPGTTLRKQKGCAL